MEILFHWKIHPYTKDSRCKYLTGRIITEKAKSQQQFELRVNQVVTFMKQNLIKSLELTFQYFRILRQLDNIVNIDNSRWCRK